MNRTTILLIREDEGIFDRSDKFIFYSLAEVSTRIFLILCGDFAQKTLDTRVVERCKDVFIEDGEYSDFKLLRKVLPLVKEDVPDELLFVDNSVFGPFYELGNIIDSMAKKGYDFWGMTKVGKTITDNWEETFAYVQTYFLVMNKRLLQSKYLYNYFLNTDNEWEFPKSFTHYLQEQGFVWDAYINSEKYFSDNITRNFDIIYDASLDLVKNYHFPFIKKDSFCHVSYSYSNGSNLKKVVQYLDCTALYDVDIIWETVLRKYNITAIKDAMNLNYILPVTSLIKDCECNELFKKTVIIMHVVYEESIFEITQYLKGIPGDIHKVFVTINEKTKDSLIEMIRVNHILNYEMRIMIPNRGRDMNALLVTCGDVMGRYTYLCFTHDKRTSNNNGAWTIGKSFMEQLWDNTLKSKGFIKEVLYLLSTEKRLGLLTMINPYFGPYAKIAGNTWTSCYSVTKKIAEMTDVNANISEEYQPFGLGNAFWCKTKVFDKILKSGIRTEDFPEEPMAVDGTFSHGLERFFIYAAQDRGYYSGTLQNSEYAENSMSILTYMTNHLISVISENPMLADQNTFEGMCRKLERRDIELLREQTNKIYVYGTGATGKRVAKLLQKQGVKIEGFICSDGYPKEDSVFGVKTYYLSEVDTNDRETGIIIAINRKFYSEIRNRIESIKCRIFYL